MVVETRSAKKAKLLQKPSTIGRNGTMALVVPSATGKGKRVLYSYPSGYDNLRRSALEKLTRDGEEPVETEVGEDEAQTETETELSSNRFITPLPSTILTPQPPMAPKKVVPITARTILEECSQMPIFRWGTLEEGDTPSYANGIILSPTPSPAKKLSIVTKAQRLGPQSTDILEEAANYKSLGSPFRIRGSKAVVSHQRPHPFGPHEMEAVEENLMERVSLGRGAGLPPRRQLRRQ